MIPKTVSRIAIFSDVNGKTIMVLLKMACLSGSDEGPWETKTNIEGPLQYHKLLSS